MKNDLLKLITELRRRTGIGIIECKKSLVSSNGDIELAIDNLRKSHAAKSLIKNNKLALDGGIFTYVTKNIGVILELNCETDFVAKNKNFINFANLIISTAASEKIKNLNTLKQRFEEARIQLVSLVSENIVFRRFCFLEGEYVSVYQHLNRIGVLLNVQNYKDKRSIKELAMHIAASKPKYLSIEDIPIKVLDREKKIQLELAMNTGKSISISEKIVSGRMKKFSEEVCLLEQNFILNPKVKVKEYLNNNCLSIISFVRFEIGECNY